MTEPEGEGDDGKRGRWRWRLLVGAVVAVVAVVALAAVQLLRPLPRPEVRLEPSRAVVVPGDLGRLAWPRAGSAALSVMDAGTVGTSGADVPVPIASVAKVMTAVVILRDHPLPSGAPGPSITMRPVDVQRFRSGAAVGQSELAVTAGEQLSERQVLEALLVGSANNMATALAEWDAGSVAGFVAKMNTTAAHLNLSRTHYTDPSGFDAATVSTATDQIRLGEEAMRDATFAEIVALPAVSLPVAGRVANWNRLVGRDGIVGIKTGSTRAAGGCLVFAVRKDTDGDPVTIVGAVLGQPGTDIITASLDAGHALAVSVAPLIGTTTVVEAGAKVGTVTTAWGATVPLVTATPIRLVTWPGLEVHTSVRVRRAATVRAGEALGSITASADREAANAAVRAASSLRKPSVWWRLTRLRRSSAG